MSDVDASRLTHINYAFANLRDGEVVEGFASDAENFRRLRELRQRHPHLRVLVAVGGWTWSGGFSDAALTVASRERLVRSAVAFVQRHDLDGLDIDWEYPGLPGNGNTHRPEDKANFTAMMAALRAGLDDLGRPHRPHLPADLCRGGLPEVHRAHRTRAGGGVDRLGQPDDVRLPRCSRRSHRRAPREPVRPSRRRQAPVRGRGSAGVPGGWRAGGQAGARRAVLRARLDGRPCGRNGLYQPGIPLIDAKGLSYGRLAADLVGKDGYERHWDATAQQPYLWNASRRIFIAYDDPESVRRKAQYVVERGLAGVMYWQHGSDRTGTLLQALHESLREGSTHR